MGTRQLEERYWQQADRTWTFVAVLDDGTITASEVELLRVACGLMHVPLPALLA